VAAPTAPAQPAAPDPSAPIWIAADGRPVLRTGDAVPVGTLRPIEGAQPAFPNPELLPAGASITPMVDEAGRPWFHIVAEGVDKTVAVGEFATLPPVTVTGHRLPRDEFGNQLEVDAQGNGVVHLVSGGLLVIGNAAEALPGLSAGARTIAGSLLSRLSPLTLLLMLSGDTPRVDLQISDTQRFDRLEGQPYGRLWERDPSTGEWKIARTDVREYQQPAGFAILSDEELRNLREPLINVPAPPQPSGPPPLTPPPDRVDTQTPPFLAQQPAGPIVEVYPAGPPLTIDDLIIESGATLPAAEQVADYVLTHNGAAPPGYVGGRTFENDGRDGGQVLPSTDGSGASIDYKEYDVRAKVPGMNRGTERVVIGSDGSAWYTADHYRTFTRIRP
jgi:ribonuclease